MLSVQGITPFVCVPDIGEAIGFYEGPGFECAFQSEEPSYAYMRCEGGAIRLLETQDPGILEAMKNNMVYIDVASADAFWEAYRPFLQSLPDERVRAPHDQPYKQRELHVLDPGGSLIFCGHDIRPR